MSENLRKQLQRANFYYMSDLAYPERWKPLDSDDEFSQWAINDIMGVREKLDAIPHDESGLKMGRMACFAAQHRIGMKPFSGIRTADQPTVNKIIDYAPAGVETMATRIQLPDFIYVNRDGRESYLGPESSEASLMHEVFHAENLWQGVLIWVNTKGQWKYGAVGNGFATYRPRSSGDYREEAGAELWGHEYLTKELGLWNGFAQTSEPISVNVSSATGPAAHYLLPASYICENPRTGRKTWSTSAHAAFGQQLMNARDPGLWPAILASRTDPTIAEEVVGRTNELASGLDDVINNCSYQWEQFARVTGYIIDKLYEGDARLALEVVADMDDNIQQLAA